MLGVVSIACGLFSPDPARATTLVRRSATIACVDPHATYTMGEPGTARQSRRWIAALQRRGRCFDVQPGTRWQVISRRRGLLLMRLAAPEPGIPPLYFRRGGTLPEEAPKAAATIPPPAASAPDDYNDNRRVEVATLPPAPGATASQATGPAPLAGSPPDPSPAPPAAPANAAPLVTPPVATPLVPGASASGGLSAAAPASGTATAAPRAAPDASAAWRGGYRLGFVAALLILAGLLSAGASLLALVLRKRRRAAPSVATSELSGAELPPEPAALPPPLRLASVDQVLQIKLPVHETAMVAQRLASSAPAAAGRLATSRAGLARSRCAALLREAGWDAVIDASPGPLRADVVARRGGRTLAVLCLPAADPLGEAAIEEACMAREREQADLAAIISEATPTHGARELADQAGVAMLRADELRDFGS